MAVKYDVPNTIIDPGLDIVKEAVNKVAQQMLKVVKGKNYPLMDAVEICLVGL